MKVAFDARLMIGGYRGMGQFARALLEPVRNDAVALLAAGEGTQEWPMLSRGHGFYPWWEQCVLPGLARDARATHLLCPYNTAPVRHLRGIRKLVVVHDLIFMEPLRNLPTSRSLYQNIGRLYRRWVVPAAVRSADVIVTVSEHTRAKLVELPGISPGMIRVIPNSVPDDWLVDAPLADELRGRYLLVVAGEAPSKNLRRLLEAFAIARRQGMDGDIYLRVAGVKPEFHGAFVELAACFGIEGVIRMEPYLDSEALRCLYREAWGFVMPSLYEGFGIPLIEAMASGTPVACSNTTSLPEVVGDAGWQFNPREVADIARALNELALPGSRRAQMMARGLMRASQFSRSMVAEKIASFWHEEFAAKVSVR